MKFVGIFISVVAIYLIFYGSVWILGGLGKSSWSINTVNITSCTDESRASRGQFILDCIRNGNPKSDEEPEGWINICKSLAESTLCDTESGFYYFAGFKRTKYIPCSQAKEPRELLVCGK